MAFPNAVGLGITTETVVYTAPKDNVVVIGIQIANTTANPALITVKGPGGAHILKDGELPQGAGLSVLKGKMNLAQGQSITVSSDQAVDAIISVME